MNSWRRSAVSVHRPEARGCGGCVRRAPPRERSSPEFRRTPSIRCAPGLMLPCSHHGAVPGEDFRIGCKGRSGCRPKTRHAVPRTRPRRRRCAGSTATNNTQAGGLLARAVVPGGLRAAAIRSHGLPTRKLSPSDAARSGCPAEWVTTRTRPSADSMAELKNAGLTRVPCCGAT
jgi:hypothetical protein